MPNGGHDRDDFVSRVSKLDDRRSPLGLVLIRRNALSGTIERDDAKWVADSYGQDVLKRCESLIEENPELAERDIERLAFDVYAEEIKDLEYDPVSGSRPPVPERSLFQRMFGWLLG